MDFPKLNFHTHTIFSDGKNSIRQLVSVALKIGLDYLAITDHFSDSWKANVIPTLDSVRKIEAYMNVIEECQDYLKTNNKNLRLFKGIEIDIGSSEKIINTLIRPKLFDIILFEYIESPEGISFITNILKHWKKTQETTWSECRRSAYRLHSTHTPTSAILPLPCLGEEMGSAKKSAHFWRGIRFQHRIRAFQEPT